MENWELRIVTSHHVNYNFKNIPYGFKKYNSKICSDVEKMIIKDIEELDFQSANKETKNITFNRFKNFILRNLIFNLLWARVWINSLTFHQV